ncbi:MAG: glycosyltransferase [Candidatus Bathyarchaeia archaeon]
MKKVKVAFLGARGLGNYGGAETFVLEVSSRLRKIFEVYVACVDKKFYEAEINGVKLVGIHGVQHPTTTIPSLNDLIATMYLLRKHKEIDVIHYVAPYGALAAIIAKFTRKKVSINPDGVEWKRLIRRLKFVPFYQKPIYILTMIYMFFMEFLSCKVPDITVADSIAIKSRLQRLYKPRNVAYIAYGSTKLVKNDLPRHKEERILNEFGLEPHGYYLTIGRLVAENNIHIEIEAFKRSNSDKKLLVIGNVYQRDPYIKHLYKLKNNYQNIIITGPVWIPELLQVLRKNCFAYIHAYEVGGTNPSLLEQMQYRRPILAYDVAYNKEVLGTAGIYFKNSEELAEGMRFLEKNEIDLNNICNKMFDRLHTDYNWEHVATRYADLFRHLTVDFSDLR